MNYWRLDSRLQVMADRGYVQKYGLRGFSNIIKQLCLVRLEIS